MIDFDAPALPSEFIARVGLTSAELLFGFRNSWLNERGVIGIALSQYADGVLVDDALEQFALLLDAERGRVRDMMLVDNASAGTEARRVWIFLFAKWIFENDDTPDSFQRIEELYAAFEYPESLEGFVGYLPAEPGAAIGRSAMEDSWRNFIDAESEYFGSRRLHGSGNADVSGL